MVTMISRLRLRREWFLLVATLPLFVTLLFLGVYALYMRDGTVVYWLTMLYDYTAFGLAPLVVGVGLAVLFLVVLLALQIAVGRATARPRLSKPYALVTVSILLLGLLCSCGSFLLFSDMFASTHVDSLQSGSHVYQLAYRPTLGFNFVFVVYECDGAGIFCHARTETCALHGGDSSSPTVPDARLRVNAATGAVSAQIPDSDIIACGSLEPYPS